MRLALPRLRALRQALLNNLVGPEVAGLEARNFRYVCLDAAWMGILNGIAGTFTNVFAVRLGAPDFFLGLMASGPALLTILFSLPAARLVQRYSRQRVRLVMWGRLWNRLGYFTFAIMPFLFPAHLLPLTILLATIAMSAPGALLNIVTTSVLAEVLPPERRAQAIGVRYALMGATNALAVLVSGKLLDLLPFPLGYQVLFLVAGATSLVSIYYVSLLRIPEEALDSETPPSRPPSAGFSPRRWWEALRGLGQHRAYVIFLAVYVLYQWGMAAPGPLFSIYWVRNLRASDSWIGLLSMVGTATTVIVYFPWGRFAARRGNRTMLIICALGVSLYPIITALSPRMEPLLGLSLFSGVVSAGLNIAVFNVLLEVSPSRGRAGYLALHSALVNVSSLLGPLFGTALSSYLGVVVALLICGAIRLGGASLFVLVPKEPPAKGR